MSYNKQEISLNLCLKQNQPDHSYRDTLLTLQTAHDYCRTFEAAELQNTSLIHQQLRVLNVHFTLS